MKKVLIKILGLGILLLAVIGAIVAIKNLQKSEPVLKLPPINSDLSETGAEVQLDTPLPNSLVKSPLIVKGKARGSWFFEATFPVRILDADGKILGSGPAHALGEWMTSDFVPFSATVEFKDSATDSGMLLLQNDNPSGLPANAKQLIYPIRFR